MTCTTVREMKSQVEEETGLGQDEQTVLYRGRPLQPADHLSEAGVSVGDTLNIIKKRNVELTGKVDERASSNVLPPGYTSMLKELAENMNPESMKLALSALEGMLESNYMGELFSDEQMEAARIQALAHIDEYDALIPGLKNQLISIASDPAMWKESMHSAKLKISEILKEKKYSRDTIVSKVPSMNKFGSPNMVKKSISKRG